MKNRLIIFAVTIVVVLTLSGCSKEPDDNTIRTGLQDYVEKTPIGIGGQLMPDLGAYGGPKNRLVDYEITNQYSHKEDGERFYVYDFNATIAHYAGQASVSGTIAFVRRGESWYSIRIQ